MGRVSVLNTSYAFGLLIHMLIWCVAIEKSGGIMGKVVDAVSYTHLTLPTTPYV